MKIRSVLLLVFCLMTVSPTLGHDLFLKPEKFRILQGDKANITVLNGYFNKSEGPVYFQRLNSASFVTPNGTSSQLLESWFTYTDDLTQISFATADPGTYVVGISTKPRDIMLLGKDFNEYLEHDGIPDILAARKRDNELGKSANEVYSKHVKTILQSGAKASDSYKTRLGFPVEIVPVKNPYAQKSGSIFEFLCLKDGKPLVNQYIMSGRELRGKLFAGPNVRTDKNGIARIRITQPGKWYVKFIEMVKLGQPNLDYESKWATITFEIK